MGKRLNSDEMQTIFEILQKSYDVYGPKIYQGTGCFSDTDIVRYGLLNSWEELVWDQKSDYSFKEVLFPVSETILYFTEDEMKTADGVARQRLIFLKSCDFHALKRLDEMYLKNGAEDYYYRRMRENTVFAVMGCKESGKNCFCVSMGTNRCEEYDMYIFPDEKGCYMELRCRELEVLLWDYGQNAQEKLNFVEKNEIHVEIPENLPDIIHQDSMWQEAAVLAVVAAILSVRHVPVLLCRIFFIKIIQRQESGAAYGLPVRWMDILTLQEDTASVRARVKECALRYYIKLQIIRKDLDIICVSAVDVVKMSVRNIFPMLHAFRN